MTLKSEISICLARLTAIENGLKTEAEHAENAIDARAYRDAMVLVKDIKKDMKKRLEALGI